MQHVTLFVHRACYTLSPRSGISLFIQPKLLAFWLFRCYLSQPSQRLMQVTHTGSTCNLLQFVCIDHVTLFQSIQEYLCA